VNRFPRTLLLLLLASPIAAADPEPVVIHDIALALDPARHSLRATDTITAPREACAPNGLHLRLRDALQVVSATADGKPIELALCIPHSSVGPPQVGCRIARIPEGAAALTLAISYEGEVYDPPRKDEQLRFVVGDKTSGTIAPEGVYLHGGSFWYPSPVAPGAAPLLQHFDVEITVPAGWHGVGQGSCVRAETSAEANVSRWENPVTCDSLSIAAGPFKIARREWNGITIATFLFEEDEKLAPLYLEAAERFLKFYSELLRPYPYRQFSVVENFFPTGYGMPGYTLLGSDVVKMADRYTGAVGLGHEILHCWWGNFVLAGETEENWCEGLTTYCANYLFQEKTEGDAAAREYRRHTSTRFSVLVPPGKDYPVRKFAGKVNEIDNEVGYGKCSMVFHQVRRMLGDEKFFAALRAVLASHGGRHASFDDFRKAFEQAGARPLGDFFAQWLDRPGAPVLGHLVVAHTRQDEGPYTLRVTVDQLPEALAAAPGTEIPKWEDAGFQPWLLQLPVRITTAKRTFDAVLELNGEEGTLAMPLDADEGMATRVEIDPDFHVFRRLRRCQLPPCLNLVLHAGKKIAVLPEGGDAKLREVYRGIAERLRGSGGWEIVEAAQATDATLARGALLLLGGPDVNPATKRLAARAADAITGSPGAVSSPVDETLEFTAAGVKCGLHSSEGAGRAALVSLHNPWALEHTASVFVAADPEGAARPARLLFYYGWDGYVFWQDGKALGRGHVAKHAEPMTLDTGKR